MPRHWLEAYARCLEGQIERRDRDVYVRVCGKEESLRWEARPFHDSFGGVQGIIVFSEMITEKVEAEQALRRQTRQLRLAGEIARIGYWRLDLATDDMFWSPEMYRIFERDPQTFAPTEEARINAFHPDDRVERLKIWRGAIHNREDLEHQARLIMPDGRIRHILTRGVPPI